jgi:ubiquinone/menaquinone biosynthesis C-methylase UbiE
MHARGVERLLQADLSALPFPPALFDIVTAMDVLVHLPEGLEIKAVQEMARVSRSRRDPRCTRSTLDLLHSRHSEFVGERQRFTRGRLMQVVSACGIRVRRCTYLNSLLVPVALVKFRLWETLVKSPPQAV